MSTTIMEAQLRAALDADRALTARGCTSTARHPSGVAVERGPTVVGIWYWRNGVFALHTDRDAPLATVDTVAEAVRFTRDTLCP